MLVANLLIALIVPFVSVYFAQTLVRKNSERAASRDFVRACIANLHNYNFAATNVVALKLESNKDNRIQKIMALRQATSVIIADVAMLECLFGDKARPAMEKIMAMMQIDTLDDSIELLPFVDQMSKANGQAVFAIKLLWEIHHGRLKNIPLAIFLSRKLHRFGRKRPTLDEINEIEELHRTYSLPAAGSRLAGTPAEPSGN